MRAADFEFLYILEERYWWFVGMREITDTIVCAELKKPRLRVLDAGCGTGFNLGHYQSSNGRDVYGFDVSRHAIEWVRKRGLRKVAQASVTDIPFHSGTFDIVFSFDVLQQLPVDLTEAGIREMYRVLKPGGTLFARVAAFEWLRSSHDEDNQTVHRFRRDEFVEKMKRAGFQIEWVGYANGILLPVVVLKRLLKAFGIGRGTDVKPLPRGLRWVDSIFRNVLHWEAQRFKSGKGLPFGVSVICYARKSAE
jgi:SAM-dependent methyltransferase